MQKQKLGAINEAWENLLWVTVHELGVEGIAIMAMKMIERKIQS